MQTGNGLASDDFEHLRAALAKGWGPVTLGNEIQRVRVLFKYAYDAGLIDRPVRYGPTFKPSLLPLSGRPWPLFLGRRPAPTAARPHLALTTQPARQWR